MKINVPASLGALPKDVQDWINEVTDLINEGFYQPKLFTTRPTLAQMKTGEFAQGNGTGGSGEEELFHKVNDSEIAVHQTTTRITS